MESGVEGFVATLSVKFSCELDIFLKSMASDAVRGQENKISKKRQKP